MRPFQLRNKKTGELRSNGAWFIKYKAPDGSWRKQIGGRTEAEADLAQAAIKTDIARGVWKDPRIERAEKLTSETECRTFGDIVELFRVHYRSRSECSRRNFESSVSWLTVGIRGAAPSLPLSTPISGLSPLRLRKVHEAIAASSLSVATKNLLLVYTKAILRWAWKHPAIALDRNPAEDLSKFKKTGTRGGDGFVNPVSKDEVFSREDALSMMERAEEVGPEVLAVMLRTAFETGMRKGEMCGLLWSAVDFERRMILVSRNYDRRGTKSGKDRAVPMSSGLVSRLRQWRAASPCSRDHDFVFPDENGLGRTMHFAWGKYVGNLAKAAGAFRPGMRRLGHGTRHYYATQWLLNGGSAEMLARILGHADTSMICRVYSHFQDADFVAAVDRINIGLERPARAAAVIEFGSKSSEG